MQALVGHLRAFVFILTGYRQLLDCFYQRSGLRLYRIAFPGMWKRDRNGVWPLLCERGELVPRSRRGHLPGRSERGDLLTAEPV